MDLGWTAASMGASAVASLVGGKVAGRAWHALTGKDTPTTVDTREDDDTPILQVVMFAALSAAVIALVQRLAMRQTRKWYGPALSKQQLGVDGDAHTGK